MASYGTSAGRAQGRADAAAFGGDVRVVLDQAALQRLFTSQSGPVAKELTRRTIKVDRAAKDRCPVDTGRLRSSITWRMGRDSQGLAGIVGTNVSYAPHVEFGTVRQRPQPFLRPALGAAQ